MNHSVFMNMALVLAEKGRGWTSPNPIVGAVVVKDGQVVGTGFHPGYGKPHAEVYAIDDAGDKAKGATLYVTLEPCNHTGKTPPCTEKILSSGIVRVVVAVRDPNPDVTGGGVEYLREKGVEVIVGVCESEAAKQNEVFVKYITTKRPFVVVKCAATLDGRIATRTGDSKWVSGEESRQFVHRLRHEMDAIMVGIGTIKTDNPMLTTRIHDMNGKDPIRLILDTHLSISENAQILHLTSKAQTVLITGETIPMDKKVRIEATGALILPTPVKEGMIDLNLLMEILGAKGITSILIEGGSRVIASAFKSGIADKAIFCFAPKILGGDDGMPICKGEGVQFMKDCFKLSNLSVNRFGEDVMIDGYLSSGRQNPKS